MVARSDLGFVLVAIQIWFRVCLGPNSDPVWVLVVYDLASLSFSLSLGRSWWWICVCDLVFGCEMANSLWVLIANLMPKNWWLCNSVCGQKRWKSLERESGLMLGWKRAFGSLDYVPLKQESHATHVIELSVQYNKKFNLGMQSVTKVIV